jgi:hypothetical protein
MAFRKLIFLTGLFAATSCDYEIKKNVPTPISCPKEEKSEIGRFQIVFSPHMRMDTFLLDTTTGQTWTPVAITNRQNSPTEWREIFREDNAAWKSSTYLPLDIAHPIK